MIITVEKTDDGFVAYFGRRAPALPEQHSFTFLNPLDALYSIINPQITVIDQPPADTQQNWCSYDVMIVER